MGAVAKFIAYKLSDELGYDSEKRAVLEYGAFALVQTVASIGVVFLIGISLGIAIEALIISFSGSILRKYSGGVHASSPNKCMIIGTVVCIIGALFSYYIELSIILDNINIISVILYAIGIIAVYKLVPVDTPNKQIKSKKKKDRMKMASYIIILLYALITIIFILWNKESYVIALLFGTMYQLFTLTKLGHRIMNYIDAFL